MPELHRAKAETQIDFLRLAAEGDLKAAIARHGETVSAGEAQALQALDRDELKALLAINEKISAIRLKDIGDVASDWVCVNVVC
ncbi:MAG: hypothetical protein OSA99_06705 [Acidimicrobiales bacterium]|nr:hypothetical protein [Acidimicrobiales bacterium]